MSGRTLTVAAGIITAEVGDITFKEEFMDPTVELSHERSTAEHEIVTGHDVYQGNNTEYIVQALGRQPPEITVTGWLTEPQLRKADALVAEDVVRVRTARYTGTVVPMDVDIPHERTWHEKHGWIFEVTMTLKGVSGGAPKISVNTGD